MGTIALTDARIEIDSNVVSDDANQVSLNYEAESLDDTSFGDDTRSSKGGLKNWSGDVQFIQDFANAEIDSILFPLVGTTVVLKFRATSDAISTSNPEYTGTALIQSYAPLGNSVGELAGASITFEAAGTLARNTSP